MVNEISPLIVRNFVSNCTDTNAKALAEKELSLLKWSVFRKKIKSTWVRSILCTFHGTLHVQATGPVITYTHRHDCMHQISCESQHNLISPKNNVAAIILVKEIV